MSLKDSIEMGNIKFEAYLINQLLHYYIYSGLIKAKQASN